MPHHAALRQELPELHYSSSPSSQSSSASSSGSSNPSSSTVSALSSSSSSAPGTPPPNPSSSHWSDIASPFAVVNGREPTGGTSLPLDGRGRLRRDVVDDAVHAGNLVDDPARDRLEHVVRDPRPVGGHRVLGGHRADDDGVGVRALVALHADGADGGEHREALPQLAVQVGAADLLEEHRVRTAQDGEPLLGDVADDAD